MTAIHGEGTPAPVDDPMDARTLNVASLFIATVEDTGC